MTFYLAMGGIGIAVVMGVYLYFACWVYPERPCDLFDERSPPGDVPHIAPRKPHVD